jgi:Ca2+-binding RTX toxin-like protein
VPTTTSSTAATAATRWTAARATTELFGENGNDHLTGGAGDDLIDGNNGFDIAYYSGQIGEYSFYSAAGYLTSSISAARAPTATTG